MPQKGAALTFATKTPPSKNGCGLLPKAWGRLATDGRRGSGAASGGLSGSLSRHVHVSSAEVLRTPGCQEFGRLNDFPPGYAHLVFEGASLTRCRDSEAHELAGGEALGRGLCLIGDVLGHRATRRLGQIWAFHQAAMKSEASKSL